MEEGGASSLGTPLRHAAFSLWETSEVTTAANAQCQAVDRRLTQRVCQQSGSCRDLSDSGSVPDLIHLGLWKQVVEGFQEADVIDGFAEKVQHLQAKQIADILHVGVARGDDHRQVLA